MSSVFSFYAAGLTALFLLLSGGIIGYPLTRYFTVLPRSKLLLAAPLGLAILGALSLPIFMLISFTPTAVILLMLGLAGITWVMMRKTPDVQIERTSFDVDFKLSWIFAAILLSLVPAYSVAPHMFHGGIGFGVPIYDHEKAVLIDAMLRSGLPPINPFIHMAGISPTLNYYYGWYFLAAQAARLSGANGWEADVAFTVVTAFLSLIVMGWASMRFSGRQAASWWVLPLSFVYTLTPILNFVAGPAGSAFLTNEHELEAWLAQSCWVPQHMFAAVVAILAILAFVEVLKDRKINIKICMLTGVLTGFSYDSSVWVGTIGLIPVLFVVALAGISIREFSTYLFKLVLSGIIAVAAVATLAVQEVHQLNGAPVIAKWVFPVFTRNVSLYTCLVNFLGYWLLMLVLCFSFSYVVSAIWAAGAVLRKKRLKLEETAMMTACFMPLVMAEFLHSVIQNNDLAWRCVLVSVLAMNIVASSVLASGGTQFGSIPRRIVVPLASVLLVPAVLSGLFFAFGVTCEQFVYGVPNADSSRFRYVDPGMWREVQILTPPGEAVGSNPFYEQSLDPWAGNVSWALLSNRDSCTPPISYLPPFSPGTTRSQQARMSEFITDIFNGDPQPDDFKMLRDTYKCRTLLVVPSDKLWGQPAMNISTYYHLVAEQPGLWRIYRAD